MFNGYGVWVIGATVVVRNGGIVAVTGAIVKVFDNSQKVPSIFE